MKLKNYIFATFVGSMPSMFVTVALGSGIEKIIDQNWVDSIITLPSGIFPNTGISSALIVLKKDRSKKVLFIKQILQELFSLIFLILETNFCF